MCVRPYAPTRTTLWEQLEGKSIRRLEEEEVEEEEERQRALTALRTHSLRQ